MVCSLSSAPLASLAALQVIISEFQIRDLQAFSVYSK
jgi:hypothetical protein